MGKRMSLIMVITVIGMCLIPLAVWAQTPTPGGEAATPTPTPTPTPIPLEISPTIFPWAFKTGGPGQNWQEGVIHFLLGMVGALVTVYLFLGDFLPSMGGKAEYEFLKEELKDFKTRRERALTEREKYARGESNPPQERLDAEDKLTDDYDRAIKRLERQLSQERWRLFRLGFPMYILLGGFFATAFATNLLQAVLIGFGWTAVADRIGLQRELAVRKEIRDAEISKVEKEAAEQVKEARREVEAMKAQVDAVKKGIESALAKAKSAPSGGSAEAGRSG